MGEGWVWDPSGCWCGGSQPGGVGMLQAGGGEEGCSSPGQGLLACVEEHAAAVLAATLTSPCVLGFAPKEVRLGPPIPAPHPPACRARFS